MAAKPKPALSRWLIDQRKAHDEVVSDVARITDRSDATVRGWEAGRPPSGDDPTIAVLERHWGSIAPKDPMQEQADLAAAIRDQTVAINALVALLTPVVEDQGIRLAEAERLLARLTARGFAAGTTPHAPAETTG